MIHNIAEQALGTALPAPQSVKRVASVKIPDGYRLQWSGEYEYLVKTHERLKVVLPLTALIIETCMSSSL